MVQDERLGALVLGTFDRDQNHYPTSSSSEQIYFGCYIQNLFRMQGASPKNPIKCPHLDFIMKASDRFPSWPYMKSLVKNL